jgi:hypothetical protein
LAPHVGITEGRSRSEESAMSRKLTPRQAIARPFPTWDNAMADRLIKWLDHCGYEIVEKPHAEASLVPAASDDEVVPHVEHSH